MLLLPGDLCLLSFSIVMSILKALGLGTSGSAVCISVCLTLLLPQLREIILPPSQSTVRAYNQITILTLYSVRSRLVTLF
jgi:hypothetical protein